MDILQQIGKAHLLLLHLPIGLLGLLILFEIFNRIGKTDDNWQLVQKKIVFWLAFSAMAAAVLGWLLSKQGGYPIDVLRQHRNWGWAAAVCTVVLAVFRKEKWYIGAFLITTASIAWAGHLGATLTHGENYWQNMLQPSVEDLNLAEVLPLRDSQALVFQSVIQPIFENKCLDCHNATKMKGKLRLDTPTGITAGGEHGKILNSQQPDQSELLRRLDLPSAHREHMPPATRPQLTPDEVKMIKWWVTAGADFSKNWKEMPALPHF